MWGCTSGFHDYLCKVARLKAQLEPLETELARLEVIDIHGDHEPEDAESEPAVMSDGAGDAGTAQKRHCEDLGSPDDEMRNDVDGWIPAKSLRRSHSGREHIISFWVVGLCETAIPIACTHFVLVCV